MSQIKEIRRIERSKPEIPAIAGTKGYPPNNEPSKAEYRAIERQKMVDYKSSLDK